MKEMLVLLMVLLLISSIYALCEEGQIDINSAPLEEMMKIKHLGGEGIIARRVIENRTFNSLDDLTRVKGIANWTLSRIKQEGLACVDEETPEESEEQNETEKAIDDKNDLKDEKIIVNDFKEESNIKKPITFDTISLNPKDIKSSNGEEKSEKSNSNYAIYGFIAFCILIAVLFILKIRRKKFSEFI